MEGNIDQGTIGIPLRVLKVLLQDKATGKSIVWATDHYADRGEEYAAEMEIIPDLITGSNAHLIQPRVLKTVLQQADRTRKRGEVFTPAWVCNKMNNALFADWFDRMDSFNRDAEGGWATVISPVRFPEGKTWQEFVDLRVLEITCGEAPFLVSRYDSATGRSLSIGDRIGLLDRKLRVVGENAQDESEWLKWAFRAVQSTYGYEYQGDNLLLARLNILHTFRDYLAARWEREPTLNELLRVANIISWNIWQMDGLKNTTPIGALESKNYIQLTLFGDEDPDPGGPVDSRCKTFDWRSKETRYLSKDFSEGVKTMKFDYVIGNPPYQDETVGEQKNYAAPVYYLFLEEAYKVAEHVELIHPARFLFNAGNTPKPWNEKMLHDSHLKVLWFEQDSGHIFPGTYITGGIAVTYRAAQETFGSIETFTAFPELNNILKKAMPVSETESIISIVYNQLRFDLDALYREYPEFASVIGSEGRDKRFRNNIFEKISLFSEEKTVDDDISVIGVINGKRVWRFIPKRFVELSHENLFFYKALLSSANGASGTLSEHSARITTVPFLGEPKVGYTQTFIGIGAFQMEAEANACVKYLKTKFARVMLGILKVTQDNKKASWRYVPLQDFTEHSDIDWTKSVPEIDQQLYKKYGFSKEEIDFIESHVKEME